MEDAKPVKIDGREDGDLKCVVCGSMEFTSRSALLNTAGLSFLGLDWANRSAVCYVCDQCGFVHWFLPRR